MKHGVIACFPSLGAERDEQRIANARKEMVEKIYSQISDGQHWAVKIDERIDDIDDLIHEQRMTGENFRTVKLSAEITQIQHENIKFTPPNYGNMQVLELSASAFKEIKLRLRWWFRFKILRKFQWSR